MWMCCRSGRTAGLLPTGPLEGACTDEWQWPRTLLTAAEHTGLLDRSLVALIGEDVTQAAARRSAMRMAFHPICLCPRSSVSSPATRLCARCIGGGQ